jgi:hypothetical protein
MYSKIDKTVDFVNNCSELSGVSCKYIPDEISSGNKILKQLFKLRPWGPLSLLYNGYRLSFPGVKRPERGVKHAPTSSAEVKEKSRAIPLLAL